MPFSIADDVTQAPDEEEEEEEEIEWLTIMSSLNLIDRLITINEKYILWKAHFAFNCRCIEIAVKLVSQKKSGADGLILRQHEGSIRSHIFFRFMQMHVLLSKIANASDWLSW